MHPAISNSAIVTVLLLPQAAQVRSLPLPGGTSSSPTNVARHIGNPAYDDFIWQGGWYTFPNLARPAITLRAEHAGKAQVTGGSPINAAGVAIDGISLDRQRRQISVRAPGVTIKNCRFSNFGKTSSGAVRIWDESLQRVQDHRRRQQRL